VKLAITRSSKDRVNANSHPESIDGAIKGKVMSKQLVWVCLPSP
jgi:hypothetical protein